MRLPARTSPWYLGWVAASTAVVTIVIYLIVNSGDIDWVIAAILPVAAVGGTLIGNRLARHRRADD